MKITEVTAFVTESGQMFKTREEAVYHAQRNALGVVFSNYYDGTETLETFVMEHWGLIKEAMEFHS